MSVTLPILPANWSSKPKLLSFNGRLRPGLGGAEQRIQRLGTRWAIDIEVPPLGALQAKALMAAMMKAQSLGQTVLLPWPQPTFSDSIGTPLVNGGSQTGSTLAIDGLNHAQLLTRTEEFDHANWSLDNGSTGGDALPIVTPNYAIDPLGFRTADRIQFNKGTGSGFSRIQQTTVGASAGTAAQSIFLRSLDGQPRTLYLRYGASVMIKLITLTGDWQRFSSIGTVTTDAAWQLMAWDNSGAPSSQTADVAAWGAQFEMAGAASAYKRATSAQVAAPAGTFFSFTGPSGRSFLHMTTDDALVNSSGQSTMNIAPMLRASPADNAAVNFNSPVIEGFLDDSVNGWSWERMAWSSFNLSVAEVE